ncbi:acyl-CoA reductase [Bergeyella zoohelcum]|uniref:acyl-CoA reductase n=1 Tax=Bergeyella zoohelcum TaxID=1015 RepID=UPI003736BE79
MNTALLQSALQVGQTIFDFFHHEEKLTYELKQQFKEKLRETEIKNAWFTQENLRFALLQWAEMLTEKELTAWLKTYTWKEKAPKNIGLILAGNLPMVGFHDILSVLFSGHHAMIKLSSKDTVLIPFILQLWQSFHREPLPFTIVEKLENIDALIATGSNNTAQYLSQYFKNVPHIIRKNRTSVAVLSGEETDAEIQNLAKDIFTYFGMGCRNVTRLFLPKEMDLARLFENFIQYGEIINHHAYANNYDYNKAIFLLNQDEFWDNNFVMMREEQSLFSPLSVLNFSRYENISEVEEFLSTHEEEIQCVVSSVVLERKTETLGNAQCPSLSVYADNVDTMAFLEGLN